MGWKHLRVCDSLCTVPLPFCWASVDLELRCLSSPFAEATDLSKRRHKAWARCESHRSDCPASPLAMMSSLSAICFFFGWLKLSLPLQCLFFGIKAAAQLSALGRVKHAQLFYCLPPSTSIPP